MRDLLQLWVDRVQTPIGELVLVVDTEGVLRAADWANHEDRMQRLLRLHYGSAGYALRPSPNSCSLRGKITRYFAGDVSAIDDIPVGTGGTPFQRSVWKELRRIPAGSPISYGTLAQRIARPKAVRAVGLANGSNPIGIVIPCHRVIGANGSLTGYGGGLERKSWLLDHERKHAEGIGQPEVHWKKELASAS